MKPFKAHTDAGWNDPPQFSYNESMEHTRSPKRNILNKRVAFPLHQDSSKSTSTFNNPCTPPCNNPNLPPPPTNFSHTSKTSDANTSNIDNKLPDIADLKISDQSSSSESNSSDVPVVDLNELLSVLDSVIVEKREFLNTNNKEEMIKKKIQIMKDSWESNKICGGVKKKIFDLASALKNGDKEKSNQIQVALMVDHSKICSEFISAFRQLINAEENHY